MSAEIALWLPEKRRIVVAAAAAAAAAFQCCATRKFMVSSLELRHVGKIHSTR